MPAAAASKVKPKTIAEMCRELLEIERDNPAIFTRIEAIKTELKQNAEANGKFRETFVDLGHVAVSPGHPEQVISEAPMIVVPAWSALKQPRRDKLIADGLVKIEPQAPRAAVGALH
jgi:hypothetical protein